uniref:Uncharacterized protein n=1 Tax=Acrobeloides nanus TaxID=290746 RepID=A0A914DDY3_9BILA
MENGASNQSFTYLNNVGISQPISINGSQFYVDFDTGDPTNNGSGQILNAGWDLYVTANYKSCDCAAPSTLYFYDPSNVYTLFSSVNLNDGGHFYCVPMQCSWTIINYLDNYYVNINGSISLRENSGDYIEGRSYYNYVLFRIESSYNNQILQIPSIMAQVFSIFFNTGENSSMEPGIFPSWSLTLSLTPNGNNHLSTTPSDENATVPCKLFYTKYEG